MRADAVRRLFDYNYWANRQVLAAAARLSEAELTKPTTFTWRNLKDTLLFALDVERSWRARLRGDPKEVWDSSMRAEDYPTLAEMAEHWARDEQEMRTWLDGLDDRDLSSVVDLGGGDRFPLWYFLLHILTHSAHQRRDAILLLKEVGREPPELDFLYYADHLHGRRS
jgi:uncharacterized damage-inducible protein DinB